MRFRTNISVNKNYLARNDQVIGYYFLSSTPGYLPELHLPELVIRARRVTGRCGKGFLYHVAFLWHHYFFGVSAASFG